jgi:predicted neuraminidase
VQLANGTIVSGSSTENDGWRVHIERSTDGGRSWRATPPLNDGRSPGAIQPTMLVHRDGRLQAIGRTRNDRIFTTESKDDGEHWSALSLLDLPNPNSGIDAVTLADGRFLLVYNHTLKTGMDRGTLNVAVSADGRTWQAALVLENEAGDHPGFSYPAVVQTTDGLVHVTYTWKRTRIRHVVIDPRKLTLRPMPGGTWPK